MAQADEIVVAGDGRVYVSPVGTAFPATLATTPADPWVELGWFKTDGVDFKLGRESKDIEVFQELDPVRTVVTKRPISITFSLVQTGPEQVALALGGGTWVEEGTDTGVFKYTPADVSFVDERALILEVEDGGDTYRYQFPRAVNKEGVEFTFKRDEEANFKITMSILAPGSGTDTFNILTDAVQFDPGV
jgi:hypothetical protein